MTTIKLLPWQLITFCYFNYIWFSYHDNSSSYYGMFCYRNGEP